MIEASIALDYAADAARLSPDDLMITARPHERPATRIPTSARRGNQNSFKCAGLQRIRDAHSPTKLGCINHPTRVAIRLKTKSIVIHLWRQRFQWKSGLAAIRLSKSSVQLFRIYFLNCRSEPIIVKARRVPRMWYTVCPRPNSSSHAHTPGAFGKSCQSITPPPGASSRSALLVSDLT